MKRSDIEFLTAAVRNPKESKYHYVTAWGLLMLRCFSKKSSGALNAGQLISESSVTFLAEKRNFQRKPSVETLRNSDMHHLNLRLLHTWPDHLSLRSLSSAVCDLSIINEYRGSAKPHTVKIRIPYESVII